MLKGNIDKKNLENFPEILRDYNHVCTKDYTYYDQRGMIQNKDIGVIKRENI